MEERDSQDNQYLTPEGKVQLLVKVETVLRGLEDLKDDIWKVEPQRVFVDARKGGPANELATPELMARNQELEEENQILRSERDRILLVLKNLFDEAYALTGAGGAGAEQNDAALRAAKAVFVEKRKGEPEDTWTPDAHAECVSCIGGEFESEALGRHRHRKG